MSKLIMFCQYFSVLISFELDCEILQFIGVTMLSLVHKLFIIVIQ